MKVGLTYDLREDYLAQGFSHEETAEFDSIETINAIELALKILGYFPERIGNIKQLVNKLSQGKRWDIVFNFAEGMYGIGREAQIPALLEAYQIPCTFSNSVTLAVSLDKSLTKRIVKDFGVPTAPFRMITEIKELEQFDLEFPVFAKPVAEGTSKGVTSASYIQSLAELKALTQQLLQRYQQPVLVESFLPGREFTVGIIGSGAQAEILGVLEIILRDNAEQYACSFNNKEKCEEYVEYRHVTDPEAQRAADIALNAWRALNCRDAGRVDLRSNSKGEPQFLEVNPLAGLHPTHSDLPILATQVGMPYVDLIAKIIQSAIKRIVRNSIPQNTVETI